VSANPKQLYSYRAAQSQSAQAAVADPVSAEIIRRALNSAANQMKQAAIRTSFSLFIYETLDFAVVLYDRKVRLLAQAPTQPLFMGTLGFCIEGAVEAVGGEGALEPGDILVYNRPYGTGSHAQDCALIMPVFHAGELVGYAANKAHWLDIGAMAPYCTNTTDVYQEGVVIPGVKLYRAGARVDDIYRLILANCRFKQAVEGDINSQIASLHVGAREMVRVIERFGIETFNACVERILDHGEQVVREYIKRVPDGVYRASCAMDDNGIDREPVRFEVLVTIDGSNARFDFSEAPDAHRAPINCPHPSTVCASRIVLAMLAGNAQETPNEGFFRALEVVTRPGSMFHPVEPQPCYLYAWPAFAAMEGILEAFAKATDGAVPSGSAGDMCGVMLYGTNPENNEPFVFGGPLPVGHGALPNADGATAYIVGVAHAQLQSPELQEAKLPVLYEKWEWIPDSGGAGQFRGGCAWEMQFKLLCGGALICTVERSRVPSWGQKGGHVGMPNRFDVTPPGGRTESPGKITDLPFVAQTRLSIVCGGGGGYGNPARRDVAAVQSDLLNGLITREHAEKFYPHALSEKSYSHVL